MVQLDTLKDRKDFLLAQHSGEKVVNKGVILQYRGNSLDAGRVGYTVTRRLGSAVIRNRIKRKLRAAMAMCEDLTRPGKDYVLIGRQSTLTRNVKDLCKDIRYALHQQQDNG